uniref:Uncharacterized protein n=1 Tax=Anopheles atroparvus TaxID=41427 RepID=A0A182JH99_ANOAO
MRSATMENLYEEEALDGPNSPDPDGAQPPRHFNGGSGKSVSLRILSMPSSPLPAASTGRPLHSPVNTVPSSPVSAVSLSVATGHETRRRPGRERAVRKTTAKLHTAPIGTGTSEPASCEASSNSVPSNPEPGSPSTTVTPPALAGVLKKSRVDFVRFDSTEIHYTENEEVRKKISDEIKSSNTITSRHLALQRTSHGQSDEQCPSTGCEKNRCSPSAVTNAVSGVFGGIHRVYIQPIVARVRGGLHLRRVAAVPKRPKIRILLRPGGGPDRPDIGRRLPVATRNSPVSDRLPVDCVGRKASERAAACREGRSLVKKLDHLACGDMPPPSPSQDRREGRGTDLQLRKCNNSLSHSTVVVVAFLPITIKSMPGLHKNARGKTTHPNGALWPTSDEGATIAYTQQVKRARNAFRRF